MMLGLDAVLLSLLNRLLFTFPAGLAGPMPDDHEPDFEIPSFMFSSCAHLLRSSCRTTVEMLKLCF